MNTIWLALLTGLTTGGLSCFAVQGGLLAGMLATQEKGQQKKSVVMFLVAKIVAHFILGAALGLIGSKLFITSKTQGWMQMLAGLFMILTALKLAQVHPFFDRFSFTAPKSFFRILKIQSKNEGLFAPVILGFLTVFIPCGTTQAMMLLSVSSGSSLWGSLILASFVLGTAPIFFVLGVASEKILSIKPLKYIAALLIIYMGLFSINTGQILRGSNHTFQNYIKAMFEDNTKVSAGGSAKISNGYQEATVIADNTSYKSTVSTLKVNVPVKLTLVTNNTRGCSRAFTIPSYNISRVLPATGTEIVEFTPTKTGRLTYACSMGMYTGSFNIVE